MGDAVNMTRAEMRVLLMSVGRNGNPDSDLLRKYWRSTHWRQVRDEVLAAHPVCQLCRRRAATQVHHKTYATLGRETARDVDAVCARCHRRISRG